MSRLARLARLLTIFLGLLVAFVVLMTVAFSLPRAAVLAHVRESVPLVASEGLYPRPVVDHAALQLDNYTDSQMLDIAAGVEGRNALVQALSAIKGGEREANGDAAPIKSLSQSASGQRTVEVAYARYWHGYQVALRPALVWFTYGDIRVLNILLMVGLVAVVGSALRARAGVAAYAGFLIALLLTGVYVVPMSLQFSSMHYLTLLAMLVVLRMTVPADGSAGMLIELFFVVGMLTAFLDLLTTPLLALYLPVALALAIRARSLVRLSVRSEAGLVLITSLWWAAGYALTWAAKWVIASYALGADVTADATAKASHWMSAPAWSVAQALKVNVMNLFPTIRFDPSVTGPARYFLVGPTGVLILIAVVLWVVLFLTARASSDIIRRSASVLLVVPLPYLWLALTYNHSLIHYSFTYRVQAASIFAVLYFMLTCIDFTKARRLVSWHAGS